MLGGFGLFFEPTGVPRGYLMVFPEGAEEIKDTTYGKLGALRIASMLYWQ